MLCICNLRDYFDIVWILSKWKDIVPNLILLNNALTQTKHLAGVTKDNWKKKVLEKIENADWKSVVSDVEKFAEEASIINAMNFENVKTLLSPAT